MSESTSISESPVTLTSKGTRAIRIARLTWHVLQATVSAAIVFPFLSIAERRVRVRRFAQGLLHILAVRLTVSGTPPRADQAPAMLVANHVSWLDIFAIDAAHVVRFVAKSEIRRWPVIGWLCAQGGTLFIERTQRKHTLNINEQIAAGLRAGDLFAVFPEGIISSGDVVLPFHASLLQSALSCNALLFPVAIRYTGADGELCYAAHYAGTRTLVESLRLILTQPVIRVHLRFLPPIVCAGRHRRELADEAGAVIAAALNLPAPRRHTQKASHPLV
ncbi:MAG: phospholipid/glycerol acyltransferase [Betaproteobacteria bacterium]|nr:phospholipid/glycerol acyltransferase [Betaproteobacteria bacterium]